MTMANDIHPEFFDCLLDSIESGDWSCELYGREVQKCVYHVRNGDEKIWVANRLKYLNYSNGDYCLSCHFSFFQSLKLRRALKPIVKRGDIERRANNAKLLGIKGRK